MSAAPARTRAVRPGVVAADVNERRGGQISADPIVRRSVPGFMEAVDDVADFFDHLRELDFDGRQLSSDLWRSVETAGSDTEHHHRQGLDDAVVQRVADLQPGMVTRVTERLGWLDQLPAPPCVGHSGRLPSVSGSCFHAEAGCTARGGRPW